ncbi:ABC transporter permease subunit [Microvirga massiliensis]|uniref:ABC transporter permease subunit n=1 Tax=Microvirga massiliensis TaxID=1033741 RepID=UPI00062BDE74|nr:ABC transporter permease subunit [Microvirga massiliensis]
MRPGTIVALAILALIASGFGALFYAAGQPSELVSIGPYLTRVLGFALAQAAVSTVASLVLGALLALTLTRRSFPGHRWVVAALGAAAVMPAIVVVFSVIAVYGREGWLVQAARLFGIDAGFRIFGWPGILFAHIFLNAPFVARVYLDALATAPAEHWRLAEMLGLSSGQIARHLDWPVLKSEFAPLASLIFLLCFTSFAIVLTLGGGASRATLEVAIFEALRVDLDFGRAAWLGLVQIAICAGVAMLLHRAVQRSPVGRTSRLAVARPDSADRRLQLLDGLVLAVSAGLILPPLASVASGLSQIPAILDRDLAQAVLTSLMIASLSASAACLVALALAAEARNERLQRRRPGLAMIYDFLPTVVLAVPPFALTAGLYLWIRRIADPVLAGYILLPLMNALVALPFAYRFISPAVMIAGERYGRLSALLGLEGVTKVRIVTWPLLRRPFAAAFAMAMALSFGDFGVVALFGGGELRTLPYLLYERLGAYRLDEASAIGLLLVAIAFALAYAASGWSDARR